MKNVLKVSVGVEPEIPSCLDSAPSLATFSNVLESQKLMAEGGRGVTEITFQKVITGNEGTFCRGKLVSLHCKKPLFQKSCIVNGKPVVKNNHLCLCP